MQSIGCANEKSPSVAEERAIPRTSCRSGSEIGNDDDIELEALGLMHRKHPHHVVGLRDDLRLRFANRCVVRAIPELLAAAGLVVVRER